MSTNPPGFVVVEAGRDRFVAVADPSHLRLWSLQLELERIRAAGSPIYCSCGRAAGQRRRLYVHRWSSSGLLGLARNDVAEHPDGTCWLTVLRGGKCANNQYSSAVFGVASSMPEKGRNAHAGGGGTDHLDFSRTATHLLAEGHLRAFVAANSAWKAQGFRLPDARVLFAEIEAALSRPRFRGGSAYAAAAAFGARLRFGLLTHQADAPQERKQAMAATWFVDGKLFSETVLVPAEAWGQAIGDTVVSGAYMAPPYLTLAVVEESGEVRKLRLLPCFCDGRHLVPKESAYEAGFAAFLIEREIPFFKPILRGDTATLCSALDLSDGWPFEFRPDYIVPRHQGRLRIYVTELRGFRAGARPEYDDSLRAKAEAVERAGETFVYKEPLGWDYQKYSSRNIPAAPLVGFERGWLGFSPAAAGWLGQLARETQADHADAQRGRLRLAE